MMQRLDTLESRLQCSERKRNERRLRNLRNALNIAKGGCQPEPGASDDTVAASVRLTGGAGAAWIDEFADMGNGEEDAAPATIIPFSKRRCQRRQARGG
jgi:hypothetical protein